ncbi:hypothetical protein AA309_21630 [Microvirga vignae]|uniref:DUF5666 domain-containing protein n=1 Tax=Microvirga vignae TaxID=1225564 RepID=A0A0H1RF02_9HYPH|nr:hypothetical protein AA309_21630 [Microvirga vignae]
MAALVLLFVPLDMARGQDPRDRGIGGTGVVSGDPESDRGIGGTGVMGTIRGFGSIIVNGLRVTYAPDVPVRVDGQPRAVSDLKIGQVVQVVAETQDGVLRTRQIDVASEVVGTIEATSGKTLRVLGQAVSTEKLNGRPEWRRGERVAVFGLRRPDGTIVASLIEPRAEGPDRVVGSVTKLRDGSLRIGPLRLSGATPALVGTRAVLEGSYKGGVLDVTRTTRERNLLGPEVRRFSIEAYVERTRNGLRLSSGLELAGRVSAALPAGSYAAAVVTIVADQKGRLGLERVSLEGRSVRSSGSSQGPDRRSAPSTPAGAQGHKSSPLHPDLGPAQSPLGGSRPGAARGRSDNSDSPGNAGNSRGGSADGGGKSGGSGNSGGNGNGHGGGGNAGGNGNGGGNGGGGRR